LKLRGFGDEKSMEMVEFDWVITNPHDDSPKNQTTTLQHGVFANDFPDMFGPWAISNHPFQNPSEQFLDFTWNQYWVTRFFLFNICYPFL